MTDTLIVKLTVCDMRFLSFQLELKNFETQPAASALTQTKLIAATLACLAGSLREGNIEGAF